MYNKLFTKIVDSSIWMEDDHVRLIWMMFIAIMDEDGFVNLATTKNVAQRAVMTVEKAENAIAILEAPDKQSSNPANEGRRLGRVPGGWMVLNSEEYRNIIKREHQKELNRERVRKHRKRNADVMQCNAQVTHANETVTPSDTDTDTDTEADTEENTNTRSKKRKTAKKEVPKPNDVSQDLWDDFMENRKAKRLPMTKTALEGIRREGSKVGWNLERVLGKCCTRGWASFDVSWLEPSEIEQQSRVATAADFGEGGYRP